VSAAIPESARQLITGEITFEDYYAGLDEAQEARGGARLLRRLLEDTQRPGLANHERRVLDCAARGLSSREAAAELGITFETERTVRKHVLRKLGARNMTHAVALVLAKERP
jgi:DNA-binding CsgD family transcriptional regulator